jgi:hypothetical protein|eukprot:COSAG02_NODE_7135_length_3164_cov_16.656444_2_plen_77_part_00
MFGKDYPTARARGTYSLLESAQFTSNAFDQVAPSATLRCALHVVDRGNKYMRVSASAAVRGNAGLLACGPSAPDDF